MATLILDVPAPVAAKWYALSEDERRRRLPALIETIEAVLEVSESVDKDSDPATREPCEEPPAPNAEQWAALTQSEEAALDSACADTERRSDLRCCVNRLSQETQKEERSDTTPQ